MTEPSPPAFRVPTRVHLAPGSRRLLPGIARRRGLTRLLLVTDPGLARWTDEIRELLVGVGIEVVVFDAVAPNPRTGDAEAAAAILRDADLGAVVGLGGGSALDAAKAAAMLATNPGPAADYAGRERFRADPLPMIALPTTCGTGSEVTWVSVLSDPASRRKISLKGERMFPAVALVDADFLSTLPEYFVAWTGLDALTHAVEATVGRAANPVSDALAEAAIGLLVGHLERAVADPEDAAARAQTMRAATFAGLAFGNADVAGVHCLSESLGGLYDVPHGLANALLLVPILRHLRPSVDRRLAELLPILGGEDGGDATARADEALERLARLVAALDLPPFGDFRIPTEDYPRIASLAVENGSNPSNPRPMDESDYRAVLAALH